MKIVLTTRFIFLDVKGDELRFSSKYIYFGKKVRSDFGNQHSSIMLVDQDTLEKVKSIVIYAM
jgi:hypothetical protein